MKYFVLLLSVVAMLKGEEEQPGGVSAEKKLKIVIKSSSGKCNMKVKEGDRIHWKYRGTLTDGQLFDTGGYTATIGKNHVIKGVDEGMRGMCVGEKRQIAVHSSWAYGDKAQGNIPPSSNLIFEVQLLYIDRPNVAMETLEAKLRKKGGVSDQNKLKIDVTFAVPSMYCKLKSQVNDNVMWHYTGRYLNGTVFKKGGYHSTLGRKHVIKGIDDGLKDMCIGEKRKLTIHPDLVTDEGEPGFVPRDVVLVYDVILSNIQRPKEEL